jgi:UDP-N-acetylglucosamine--N-acetylmuramyl-(pentapeptide) pyrophosphoryl-undecaprenol N-acetylglucosamine transferase
MMPSAPKNTYRPLGVVIAGGGTGGHLFPGIAIAQAFCAFNPGSRILFVGSGRPLELKVVPAAGFAHETIRVEGLKGRGRLNQLVALSKLPGAVFRSLGILRRFGADLLVGVGGYAAGPVVLAARMMGVTCVLQEQNLFPGITNRALARFAREIYVSFPETRAHFGAARVRVTGNPVREELLQTVESESCPTGEPTSPKQPFTVVILGGSQGAHAINMAMIDMLPLLEKKDTLRFIHQTGSEDEVRVRGAYEKYETDAVVAPFFDNMAELYGQADLIICRAGATTVAELTALGKAAVFVPYPYAADDHQTLNARAMEEKGAAKMVPQEALTGKWLRDTIIDFANRPDTLHGMAAKAKKIGRPHAAREIVENCYRLLAA